MCSFDKSSSGYYQWVSLMLAVQAILCYLPRLVWEMITFNRVGTNLTFLLESAKSASRETGKERSQRVQFVANALDTLLFARRKMHHREDTRHPVVQFLHSATDMLPRKRIGSALVFYYMHAKLLYLGNAVAQILLMERFLGLGSNYRFFGVSILQDLLSGRNWNETLVFPRVGFCRIPVKIVNSPIAPITAQCTLPVNMLNEKIYIFLWFW
ncbi:unnamed protein product [Protopolystoma xenopodis]|uniref:Innexin n=1 Tax=Protopolystoma xenopodis TaxID=117903 RepID=A0A3S5A404_9PLAT|nr:unnamed protein product [Protopolystoma xenopodis]